MPCVSVGKTNLRGEDMKSRIRFAAFAFMAASFISLTARPASAVSNTYNASGCHAVEPLTAGQSLTVNGGAIKSSGSLPVTVVCPVPKTTSGLGVSNDAVTSLTLTGSGSASCTLWVVPDGYLRYSAHRGADTGSGHIHGVGRMA